MLTLVIPAFAARLPDAESPWVERARERLFLAGLGDYPLPQASAGSMKAKASTTAVTPVAQATAQPAAPALETEVELRAQVRALVDEMRQLKETQAVHEDYTAAAEKEQSKLRITSWLDLDFSYDHVPKKPGSFDAEHLYYIFSGQVSPDWKAYSEIEFERGAELVGGGGFGEILVEQAWADYTRSDRLGFRFGKFLTPYGVWNRNHWDPITDTSTQPFTFRQALIPVNQTGVSARGSLTRKGLETEWIGYLTNGRGKTPHADDDNGNKAVGFDVSTGKARRWRLGVSGFTDADGRRANLEEAIAVLWGTWDHGPWHVASEWLRDFGDAPVDSFYAQPSYRFDKRWKGVVRYDTWNPDRDSPLALRQHEFLAGVNRRFADSVLLKLEYVRHADSAPGSNSYNRYASSLSILF